MPSMAVQQRLDSLDTIVLLDHARKLSEELGARDEELQALQRHVLDADAAVTMARMAHGADPSMTARHVTHTKLQSMAPEGLATEHTPLLSIYALLVHAELGVHRFTQQVGAPTHRGELFYDDGLDNLKRALTAVLAELHNRDVPTSEIRRARTQWRFTFTHSEYLLAKVAGDVSLLHQAGRRRLRA